MVRVITTLRPLFSKLVTIFLLLSFTQNTGERLEVLSFPLNPRLIEATLVHSRLLQKIFLVLLSFTLQDLLLVEHTWLFLKHYLTTSDSSIFVINVEGLIPILRFEGLKGIPLIFLIRNMILFALNNSSNLGLKVVC